MKFIKYKSENNISEFRLWMKIIASSYIPQIESENQIINEWYYHLLNINKTPENINIIPTKSDIKEGEDTNYSASEEEHYSISTAELDIKPIPKPIIPKQIQCISPNNNIINITNLLHLPTSWLLHLFCNYFSFHTLLNILPLVCQSFRTLCSDTNVWKAIKFPITTIRNIYNESHIKNSQPPTYDPNNNTNNNNNMAPILYNNLNTLYFESFLIRSCRLLQIITFEGSIEENDWNSWNHIMK